MDARPIAVTTALLPEGIAPLGSRWLACHPHPGGAALHLLSGVDDELDATARLSAVLEHLALDVDQLCWVHPAVSLEALPRWSVWRADDHGGEFRMRAFRCRAAAERYAAAFEARAHKQTYWVEPGDRIG